jgi:hypothetical protein
MSFYVSAAQTGACQVLVDTRGCDSQRGLLRSLPVPEVEHNKHDRKRLAYMHFGNTTDVTESF